MAKDDSPTILNNTNNTYSDFNTALKNVSSSYVINDVNTYNPIDLSEYESYAKRKTKVDYFLTNDGLLLLEGFARDGLSHNLIAKQIGVSSTTLYDWENKYPKIKRALAQTREVVIRKLENAAMKSALGYTVTLIKPMIVKKPIRIGDKIVGYQEIVEYVAEQEFVKPEWNMQQFLLKNIARDKYKGDAKQIAEAMNEERVLEIINVQKSMQQALLSVNRESLEDEEVQVINNGNDATNDTNK